MTALLAVLAMSTTTPRPTVALVVAASPEEAEGVAAVVRDLLARTPVDVRFSTRDRVDPAEVLAMKPTGALARVWVDLGPGRPPTVYVTDDQRRRVLIRSVAAGSTGSPEVVREAVGQIVLVVVEALLSGTPVGQAAADVDPTLLPLLPRRQPRALRLAVGAFYEAGAFSSRIPIAHGPGLTLALGPGPGSPGLVATAQMRLPVKIPTEPVGAELRAFAFRLLGTMERPVGNRTALRAGVGGGVDLTGASPRAATGAWAASGEWTVDAVLRAGLELRFAALSRTTCALAAAVDLVPWARRYVVLAGDRSVVALSPWAIRPAIALTLSTP